MAPSPGRLLTRRSSHRGGASKEGRQTKKSGHDRVTRENTRQGKGSTRGLRKSRNKKNRRGTKREARWEEEGVPVLLWEGETWTHYLRRTCAGKLEDKGWTRRAQKLIKRQLPGLHAKKKAKQDARLKRLEQCKKSIETRLPRLYWARKRKKETFEAVREVLLRQEVAFTAEELREIEKLDKERAEVWMDIEWKWKVLEAKRERSDMIREEVKETIGNARMRLEEELPALHQKWKQGREVKGEKKELGVKGPDKRIKEWLRNTENEKKCFLRTRVSEEEREEMRRSITEEWSVEEKRPRNNEGELLKDGMSGRKRERFEATGNTRNEVPAGWQCRKKQKSKWVWGLKRRRMDEKRKKEMQAKWWNFPSPGPPWEKVKVSGK